MHATASSGHERSTHWLDGPNPRPKRRKPMEQLIAELAEREGRPVWAAEQISPTQARRIA